MPVFSDVALCYNFQSLDSLLGPERFRDEATGQAGMTDNVAFIMQFLVNRLTADFSVHRGNALPINFIQYLLRSLRENFLS
jgi:hypothetical protein